MDQQLFKEKIYGNLATSFEGSSKLVSYDFLWCFNRYRIAFM